MIHAGSDAHHTQVVTHKTYTNVQVFAQLYRSRLATIHTFSRAVLIPPGWKTCSFESLKSLDD